MTFSHMNPLLDFPVDHSNSHAHSICVGGQTAAAPTTETSSRPTRSFLPIFAAVRDYVASIMSAAFSAIIMVAAFVFPLTIVGMIDASATRSFEMP